MWPRRRRGSLTQNGGEAQRRASDGAERATRPGHTHRGAESDALPPPPPPRDARRDSRMGGWGYRFDTQPFLGMCHVYERLGLSSGNAASLSCLTHVCTVEGDPVGQPAACDVPRPVGV